MAFVYPLLTPILDIVSKYTLKCCYRCCSSRLNQREANILSEGPQVEVPNIISNYMNMLFTCVFYSILIPHCVPICCLGSVYFYLILKFMLLRFNKVPDLLSEFAVTFFSNGLPFFGIIWTLFFIYFIEIIKTKVIGERSYIFDLEPLYDYNLFTYE
jgi:hypothetical protein